MKQNMKASLFVFVAMLITITSFISNPVQTKAEANIDLQADSAILVDAETGKVLYSKQPDMALPPASMVKMMTEYIVLEAIENDQISWDTTTQISDYPYSISANDSFSGVGLTQDQDYTVKELYEAMAINSDNGTTIALAELVAGSEGEFVSMMRDKAEEMGLPDYQFVNSTGLSNSSLNGNHPEGTEANATNLLSAESAALLAYNLVNDHPKALEFSSQTELDFDGQSTQNWNWMLPGMPGVLSEFGYEGLDGLKTGHTDLAGFCFTGTAERNGRRLISVVMKTASEEARFEETRKLLDYGYNQFEKKEIFPKGYQLEGEEAIPVNKGKKNEVEVAAKEAIQIPVKNSEEEKYGVKYNIDDEKLNENGKLTAPVEKNEKIGTVELTYDGDRTNNYISNVGKEDQTVDLVATSMVEKSNWFMLTLGSIGDFFSTVFTNVVDTVKGWF